MEGMILVTAVVCEIGLIGLFTLTGTKLATSNVVEDTDAPSEPTASAGIH
ncbi:MAG: hypothetical protein JWN44_2075 [Myxococcales bacterium]|nr:hypothetical protein [Myxococcales bacterium]